MTGERCGPSPDESGQCVAVVSFCGDQILRWRRGIDRQFGDLGLCVLSGGRSSTWARHGDGELKRETGAHRDRVRVMTVHGSKRLQAAFPGGVEFGAPAPLRCRYHEPSSPLHLRQCVGPDAKTADEQSDRHTLDPGQTREDAFPHAALGPATGTVVERPPTQGSCSSDRHPSARGQCQRTRAGNTPLASRTHRAARSEQSKKFPIEHASSLKAHEPNADDPMNLYRAQTLISVRLRF